MSTVIEIRQQRLRKAVPVVLCAIFMLSLSMYSTLYGHAQPLLVIPVSGSPTSIAANSVTNRVFVVEDVDCAVDVIDTTSGTLVHEAGHSLASCHNGRRIAVNQNTNDVIVAESGQASQPSQISIMNYDYQLNGIQTVALDPSECLEPSAVAVNPSTNTIYVTCSTDALVKIQAGTLQHELGHMLGLCHGGPVAVDSSTNKTYVADTQSATICVIDGSTNEVIATIDFGTSGAGEVFGNDLAISLSHSKLYVSDSSNSVSVIDLATNSVTAHIPVGSSPVGVSVDPTGNKVAVVNQADHTVSIIDSTTDMVVDTIDTDQDGLYGAWEQCEWVDANCDGVYVTEPSANQVAIIWGARASTMTAVVCSPSTVAVNQPTQCTATVTDTSATPTSPPGVVMFSSSSSGSFSPSTTCQLSPTVPARSSCSVDYTASPGAEATHTITGTYSGDATHRASSGSTSLTVTQRDSSTFVACSPSTVPVNTVTVCTATVTDTSPGTVITPSGTVTWSSSFTGVFSPTSCGISGGGGSATCSVTYSPIAGCCLPWPHTIKGIYGGDTDFSGSPGSMTIIAVQRDTITAVICDRDFVPVNAPVICTATVSDTSLGTPLSPSGTVEWDSSGDGGSGGFNPVSCNLESVSPTTSACTVTYTPNPGSEGTHTITGTYSGDTPHTGSTDGFSLTATERSTSTIVNCSKLRGSAFACTVTVTDTSPGTPITPTGIVSWSSGGKGVFSSPTCTLTGTGPAASCTVFYANPGRHTTVTIMGTYSGDTDHFESTGSKTFTT